MNWEDKMKNDRAFSIGTITLLGVPIILILLILPITALILDILILLNLLSVLVILTAVLRTKKTYYIASLPTLLLLSTLFNLAVNISATRLILTKGAAFDGWLITAIASLMPASNEITYLVMSCFLFVAINTVQLAVVNKKVARVVEVAAQFVLDALPDKQMAIDAEYSAGTIDQNEAASRKAVLLKHSDYYCAMNGATKIISSNVIVILIIFVLTITGGIAIGILLKGESINGALKTYIPLGTGSGLLFMLHAVLLSITAVIAVIRAASE